MYCFNVVCEVRILNKLNFITDFNIFEYFSTETVYDNIADCQNLQDGSHQKKKKKNCCTPLSLHHSPQ